MADTSGRFVPGIGFVQADEHFNIMEDLVSDTRKVKDVILRVQRLALEATVNIKENPAKAVVQLDQVNEGIDLLVRLFGLS